MLDIKIANCMLRYVAKVCNRHKCLRINKYYKGTSDTILYKLEWFDCN